MKQRIWQRAILITVAMLLVSFVAAPIVLAASQTWYLTDIASGSNHVMNKGSASGGYTPITVAQSSSHIWVANEVATVNVGFTAGTWAGDIKGTCGRGPNRTGTVEIGVWDGASFTSAGTSGSLSFPRSSTTTRSYTINAATFDVPQGQWLALRFNNTTSNASMDVETDGVSSTTSPNSDPGYPVPDVGAILMFAAGLGAVGWIVLRLRKREAVEGLAG